VGCEELTPESLKLNSVSTSLCAKTHEEDVLITFGIDSDRNVASIKVGPNIRPIKGRFFAGLDTADHSHMLKVVLHIEPINPIQTHSFVKLQYWGESS
jgi:hypothetical protein